MRSQQDFLFWYKFRCTHNPLIVSKIMEILDPLNVLRMPYTYTLKSCSLLNVIADGLARFRSHNLHVLKSCATPSSATALQVVMEKCSTLSARPRKLHYFPDLTFSQCGKVSKISALLSCNEMPPFIYTAPIFQEPLKRASATFLISILGSFLRSYAFLNN